MNRADLTRSRLGWAATTIDVASLSVVATLIVGLVLDAEGIVRSFAALLFVLFVPGWTACRLAGFGLSNLILLLSFGLSVSSTMLIGQVAVTRLDWAWEPVAIPLTIAVSVGLVAVLLRGSDG